MPSAATHQISADLRFSVESPGQPRVSGTLTGTGNRLEVRLSDPAHFAGRRDAPRLRRFAEALAQRGLRVVVIAGDTVLLEIGETRAPWWQRALIGTRHLKVVSARGLLAGARGRVRRAGAEVAPGAELLPPATLLPIAPTFGQPPRAVTTTHDPRRGGNPRLALTAGNDRLPPEGETVFPLRGEATTLGSAPACDIRLSGLEPLHAVIERDERDELVLRDHSSDGSTLVNGAPVRYGRILRTGARIDIGGWTLAYRRAEYADHGRPFGGRIGGELGHQRSQPDPRPRGRADRRLRAVGKP